MFLTSATQPQKSVRSFYFSTIFGFLFSFCNIKPTNKTAKKSKEMCKEKKK